MHEKRKAKRDCNTESAEIGTQRHREKKRHPRLG
jgi:hypothetical protein